MDLQEEAKKLANQIKAFSSKEDYIFNPTNHQFELKKCLIKAQFKNKILPEKVSFIVEENNETDSVQQEYLNDYENASSKLASPIEIGIDSMKNVTKVIQFSQVTIKRFHVVFPQHFFIIRMDILVLFT